MAKVTIVIDDKLTDGQDGIRISCESDPEFPDDQDSYTIAQEWGMGIVEMIVGQATDVRLVDEDDNEIVTTDKH